MSVVYQVNVCKGEFQALTGKLFVHRVFNIFLKKNTQKSMSHESTEFAKNCCIMSFAEYYSFRKFPKYAFFRKISSKYAIVFFFVLQA